MRKILVLLAAAVLLSAAPCFGCVLVKEGRPAAVIVTGPDATEPEKNAALELQSYIEQISGARLEIQQSPSEELNNVCVGQTALTKSLVPDFDWDSLKQDGILIKSSPDTLILAGDRPAGTLYAVYDFLEKELGVRFWTPGDEYVPERKDIAADTDRTYVPPFYIRENFFRPYMRDERFKVKHKLNGRTNQGTFPIVPDWGDCWELLGDGHTFGKFLPDGEYFGEHPEWYSEIDGKRVSGVTQLCLSNDECVEALAQKVLEELRRHRDPRMISVSQNDNELYCRCEKCTALAKEYGAQSGLIIRAVNHVARAVKKEFPGVLVETFAYQYSVDAPEGIKPEDNVLVRLCNINNDFGTPLRESAACPYPERVSENLNFLKAIGRWSSLTDRLMIWNYTVNFDFFYYIHPVFFCLKPDLQTFRDNGAVAVFEQGDAYNNGCAFNLLKGYMAAELMWDPEADDDALMKDFLRGYYGDAAPYLYEFLRKDAEWQRKSPYPLVYKFWRCPWLTKETFNEGMELFCKALSAVGGDPVRRERVLEEALCFQYSLVKLYDEEQQEWAGCDYSLFADTRRFEKYFLAFQKKTGNTYHNEGWEYWGDDSAREAPHLSPSVLPEALKGLGPEEYFCIPAEDLDVNLPGMAGDLKPDPLAAEGKAGVLYTHTFEWGLTRKITRTLRRAYEAGYKTARLWVSARAGGERRPDDLACMVHLLDLYPGTGHTFRMSTELLSEDKYTLIDCGEMKLWDAWDVKLIFAPQCNGAVKGGIWVDKVYMVYGR